ncbi:telomere-associated protein RIF1 isoform X2 [Gouania willdenowi]|uniref:telomere-associated protein RIF1 isoform X2 n=1 Tax=Gouania willdenowi TaxID=441366 RepID=UPI00105598ED|nr:telomere-associated protein RIF1 isoform X2 [Gouania willdenowi]
MMASSCPQSGSSLLPLLDTLEDATATQSEQTDAYLTIANRLSGDEGRHFLPVVEKHFPRLGKSILGHVSSVSSELSQAALQALGFCVFHSHVATALSDDFAAEILSVLCSLVVKSSDKNTCTRALWVISKQSFSADVVALKVSSILGTLESVWSRDDVQSVVMEHEAVNVVIRLLEQVPAQMEHGAGLWSRLLVPLVVHSASKVRLRAAAALELGLAQLLRRQAEVAAVIEPMMSTKLIPELQKLFVSKNESNVLKLWPLLVKLLGKLLHRGGPFINSLLHLEELGFRSSSPSIKKIAFLAWKSLIDNFALNPDILCSPKRMKLLLQPLVSIHVRTEALLLTKVEVWWYLVVTLGPNLPSHFDQVCVPLLQNTICYDPVTATTPSRSNNSVNGGATPTTPRTGFSPSSSSGVTPSFSSIQLLGLEMLLHFLLGPEVVSSAAKNQLELSLEPLNHLLVSGAPSFTKHASVLVSHIRDGFINVGRAAPESLLGLIWTSLVRSVHLTVESGGNKKERQGCEVLSLMLQTLQNIVSSEALPAHRTLLICEITVKGIPPRILGSASYQVGKMDMFNGTPALFLLLLLFNSSMLPVYMEDERFFFCLQTLIGCGLSGPASPLAFAEAVLSALGRRASSLPNKELVWRTWSAVVDPLTDTITQSNEVNQGDALEHNFSCVLMALILPVSHLLTEDALSLASQRSMLSSWSKLYRVFARCSSLVPTAEENACCEQLSAKMLVLVDQQALRLPVAALGISNMLQVMVECVDFSPFTPHFQHKLKSPHTPSHWTRRRNRALGNLTSFQLLLLQSLEVHLHHPHVASEATASALISVLSTLFSNLVLADAVREALSALVQPLVLLYGQEVAPQGHSKLEKLLCDLLGCLQTRTSLAFDGDLLALLCPLLCVLFPHKHKPFRTTVASFWNASFANTLTLTYPEELRPVLSQVKQATPIILPGFEALEVSEDIQGHASSESSQMETRISGISICSKNRGVSLLSSVTSVSNTPKVSMKLDFGSPKAPRNDLDDEATVDFVFIPPENKERVLTEHQKEMKRTKRVDIPVMYNNLDASLDSSVFTGFTQSQEDSGDTHPEEPEKHTEEPDCAPAQVPPAESEVVTKEAPDDENPSEQNESHEPEEVIPQSADVSVEEETKSEDQTQDVDMESKEDSSANMSTSSDLVSGTPQKPNSRRQSFITLEKYSEGQSHSPADGSSFTGPLVKTSSSNQHSVNDVLPASQIQSSPDSQSTPNPLPESMPNTSELNVLPESPRRPKESRTQTEPVKLTERLSSDTTEEEDVIPDTQTEGESRMSSGTTPMLEVVQFSSQEDDSDAGLDNSQSSQSQTSPDEPRRSGRSRIRPQIPGEDPQERESKYNLLKKRRSRELVLTEASSPTSASSRPNTRSKQAAEKSYNRLKTRSQHGTIDPRPNNSRGRPGRKPKLFSQSEDFLTKTERKRKSISDQDTDSQPETDNKRKSWKKRETYEVRDQSEKESDYEGVPTHSKNHNKDSKKSTERTSPSRKEPQDTRTPADQVVNSPLETTKTDLNQDTQEVTHVSADAQSLRRYRKSKTTDSENTTKTVDPTGRLSHTNSPASPLPGRTRRSKILEETTTSTPGDSQALDMFGSESSQGKTRYSKQRSTQEHVPSLESSGSQSSQTKEGVVGKKRGRKPRASLQSPLTFESTEQKKNQTVANDQKEETQIIKETCGTVPEDESQSQDLQSPESVQVSEDPPKEDLEVPTESEERMETDIQTNSDGALLEEREASAVEESTSETNEERIQEEVLGDSCPPAEKPEVLASVVLEEDPKQSEMENYAPPPVETSSSEGLVPLQGTNQDLELSDNQGEPRGPKGEEVEAAQHEGLCEATPSHIIPLDSPMKQKDLEAVLATDVGLSPGGSRTRGAWSPSASPSTSILKKGQKRVSEAETPSPLVKSRRVSFANPIQHQEVADNIDRRSPAVRTASPRRSKGTVQQKLVTTPIKGVLGLSPRTLNSPGFKSSKKCLISEMIRETRPVSSDCIYPALLGCSAPVEAVLPQISSTMWCRGVGQLIRAKNIRTVGDLSALTPSDIRTLPIRSPKLSNVRKALRTYEQQRKGRGVGDELRSLDEMERMTSELEERNAPQPVGEALASALEDENISDNHTTNADGERPVEEGARSVEGAEPVEEGALSVGVLPELEALSYRLTSNQLSLCSPLQLVDVHDQLGTLMRRVVVELQSRLPNATL